MRISAVRCGRKDDAALWALRGRQTDLRPHSARSYGVNWSSRFRNARHQWSCRLRSTQLAQPTHSHAWPGSQNHERIARNSDISRLRIPHHDLIVVINSGAAAEGCA
jgi:hypothetical protein